MKACLRSRSEGLFAVTDNEVIYELTRELMTSFNNPGPTLREIVVRAIGVVLRNLRQLDRGPINSALLGIIIGLTLNYKIKGLLCGLLAFTFYQCVKTDMNRNLTD